MEPVSASLQCCVPPRIQQSTCVPSEIGASSTGLSRSAKRVQRHKRQALESACSQNKDGSLSAESVAALLSMIMEVRERVLHLEGLVGASHKACAGEYASIQVGPEEVMSAPETSCKYFEIGDAESYENSRICIPDCDDAYEGLGIHIEDSPRIMSDVSHLLDPSDSIQHDLMSSGFERQPCEAGGFSDETPGLLEKLNLCVLQAVQDTFAACLPTLMNGFQNKINSAIEEIEAKLDAQKKMMASLTKRVSSMTAASTS